MNWKPMVKTGNDPKFYGNAQVFSTKEEALASSKDLMGRWMMVVEHGAEETDNPVNYERRDGRDCPIAE